MNLMVLLILQCPQFVTVPVYRFYELSFPLSHAIKFSSISFAWGILLISVFPKRAENLNSRDFDKQKISP